MTHYEMLFLSSISLGRSDYWNENKPFLMKRKKNILLPVIFEQVSGKEVNPLRVSDVNPIKVDEIWPNLSMNWDICSLRRPRGKDEWLRCD